MSSLGGALPGAAQLPQRGRRVPLEDPRARAGPGRTRCACAIGLRCGVGSSTSSSSRTSPTVISASRPPLAPRIDRGAMQRVRARPRRAGARRRSHSCPQPGEPAGSRAWAMPRTRAPAAGHRGDAARRCWAAGRRRRSRPATPRTTRPARPARSAVPRAATGPGSARQSAPAASAPLASQRSCQVSPGLVRQPVQQRQPTPAAALLLRCRRCPGTNGAPGQPRRTPARGPGSVAGQPAAAAGRGGNRRSPRVGPAGSAGCRARVSRSRRCPARRSVITTAGSRTARPASRAGSRAPRRAGPARPPAGSARRGGPAPGGSRPPCAGSGRSASWSAAAWPRTNCTSVSGRAGSSAIR